MVEEYRVIETVAMSRLKVLEYNQAMINKLGNSSNFAEPANAFFRSKIVYLLFGMIGVCITLGALGIYENWPNLELVIEATIAFVGGIQSGGMFLSLGLHFRKIKTLNLKLQEIVDHGNF